MGKIPFTLRHFVNEVQAVLNEAFERQLLVKEQLADEIERLKRITTWNNELCAKRKEESSAPIMSSTAFRTSRDARKKSNVDQRQEIWRASS